MSGIITDVVRFIGAAAPDYDDVLSRERMRDYYACRFAESTLAADELMAGYDREQYVYWRDEAARLEALRKRQGIHAPHPGALWEYFEHQESWA